MVNYEIVFTKSAAKNIPKLKSANLTGRVKKLLDIIRVDPFQNPPPYEKLVGNMQGLFSRRINIQHRLVYKVYEEEKTIQIVSVWSHFEY
ncbi:MAG: Txe/YoeB family addiction module toxin [Clostridia bacterium]|nr:Txe/YoeB family addiction module toxin [Clostridia bacterium]